MPRPSALGARDLRVSVMLGAIAMVVVALHGCGPSPLSGVEDIDGNPVDPTADSTAIASVALFIESACPISNRYAPEIKSLHERYAHRGVNFWLVYPDPDTSVEAIRAHMQDYGYSMPALRDPGHALVERANAQVTPEAAVFLADGTLVYHGRIDNRYVDISKRRPKATVHDVEEVLDALLEGKSPGPASQPAYGCYIRDLK